MPRAKSRAAPVANAKLTVDSISSTTDSINSVEPSPVKGARSKKEAATVEGLEDVVEQPLRKIKTAGRTSKKKVDNVAEQTDDGMKVIVEKKISAKGRGKKTVPTKDNSDADELQVEIQPKEEKEPKKGRGRGSKKPAVEEKPVSTNIENGVANGQEEVAVKATKNRKKKEATSALEVPKAPTKRTSKKSEKVANGSKDILPQSEEQSVSEKLTSPKLKGKSAMKNTHKEQIVDTAIKVTAKRGKGKKSVQEASVAQQDEIVQEMAISPKKKAKKDDILEKPKPIAATKTKTKKAKKIENIDEAIEEELKSDKAAPDAKRTTARKRAATAVAAIVDAEEETEDEPDGAKPAKVKKTGLVNATETSYSKADFDLPAAEDGSTNAERYNLKIASWNVAGLRSWVKKDGLKYLQHEEPDIFCMQEIKCTTDQLPEEAARIPGYHPYWLCMPGGYAGVAIYSKIMPINVEYGIGNAEFDSSGRIITAEYEKFFLINVYVPNSGRKLVNLEPRMRWEQLFQQYVQKLDAHKPVIVCGDMNVSHQEIDLANPKSNTRNAGFTKEERDKMSDLLALGYVDTFRHLYPARKGAYTYWTYIGNARSRNVGWRLDYFIVSERIVKRVVENCMRTQCLGSDHCPITLFLKL